MRRAHSALILSLWFLAPACLAGPEDESLSERHANGELDEPTGPQTAECHRTKICHIPPGNPANARTITVGGPAAPAHLAHGDYLGACNAGRACTPGSTWVCYSAPLSTDGIGECQRGVKTCNADGSGYGACEGEVVPTPEACDDLDNDCDGVVDDGCLCTPGESAACYEGPPDTRGQGICADGAKTCAADGIGYGACVGSIVPDDHETCGDGLDNNCNGDTDEGCVCPPGETWVCYTGPSETDSVGACDRGIKTCNEDGSAYGECVGETLPSPEICGNAVDEDCDGLLDNSCGCTPGSSQPCYTGPAGTGGVGTCAAGTETCNATGTGYGACVGEVGPVDEVCGDTFDNDCDGTADDGCVCTPDSTEACDTGIPGACAAGTRTCNTAGSEWGACTGAGATAEVCGDGVDNDCDGLADEGCIGDRAWNDLDRDGIQDAGEPGLAGVTFQLRTSSGALVAVDVSDVNGFYSFSGVPSGNYYLQVNPPGSGPGVSWTMTTMDAGTSDDLDSDFSGEELTTDVFFLPASGTITNIDAGVYNVLGS